MLPMLSKRSDVPGLFDSFFGKDFLSDFFDNEHSVPAVNVSEDEKSYHIEVAAPGLSKKDFKVNLNENVLTISSSKEDENEEKKRDYVRREFYYSSFSRSFTLPETADGEKIKASHKDGILNIEIPKREDAVKPSRRIEIS
jgi:HSP20 family protein